MFWTSFRAPGLILVSLAIGVDTVVAGRMAVANGFVSGFPPQTVQQLNDQWLVSGSAVSIPLPPLIALAAFVILAQLQWRWARVIGAGGCTLLAGLFVFATLYGEPTFLHPVVALEFALQLLVVILALILAVAGGWSLIRQIR